MNKHKELRLQELIARKERVRAWYNLPKELKGIKGEQIR